jgi:amidase
VRIPAACCGLVGIKTQRGRISYAPQEDHWHGLSVIGPLARTVRDAALLLDGMVEEPPAEPFAAAAEREPGALRVALSLKAPTPVPRDRAVYDAVRDVAARLQRLGHHIEEVEVDYGTIFLDTVMRYFRGIHDDVGTLERADRLERRSRHMARFGGLIPSAAIARSHAREEAKTARVNRIFEQADVVLTPVIPQLPLAVGRHEGRGALLTWLENSPYGNYTGPWNLTGQPAMAVPAGFTPEGLPLSAQLVGRPHDEATLISLAAQLEAAEPWSDRRPALAA